MSRKFTGILVIMGIALLAVFVANRVGFVRNIVYGAPAAA